MQQATRLHFTSLAPPHIVDEVVNTFVVAARKLGHEVSYQHSAVRQDAINIVCFALGLDPDALRAYPACIVLNFEPLAPGTQAHHENYLGLLRNNYVWEYSATNLQFYPELGITNGHHLPLGYEEEADLTLDLSDRLPESEKDIDVLFFGGPNERRDRVIHGMRRRGLKVVTNGNLLWEPEHRNAMIRRSRAVLNMHRFDNFRVVEMPRLSMLLRQRKAVVCELYADSEMPAALRGLVAGAPLERLVDTADLLVSSPAWRDRLERQGLEALRQLRHTDVLGPALEHFFEWQARRGR